MQVQLLSVSQVHPTGNLIPTLIPRDNRLSLLKDRDPTMGKYRFKPFVLPTCPYCGTGKPQTVMANPATDIIDHLSGLKRTWQLFTLTCCGSLLSARGEPWSGGSGPGIENIYPDVRSAASEIPEPARTYLQQAFSTLHAPDAAAVMAGAAVDAMLKYFEFKKGSVYDRVNEAVDKHILTAGMGEWAHSVRLGSNRPRHADEERPHVTVEEAQRSVEFAEALGDFLFVLSDKIEKGKQAASSATPAIHEITGLISKAPPPITPLRT
jgi:hypothetical protein